MNNFSFNIENNYTPKIIQQTNPTTQLIGHYETTIMWISLALFIIIIATILVNKKNITEYLQAASAGISWVLVYLLTITTYGANSRVYKGLVYGWIIIITIIFIYRYLEWKDSDKAPPIENQINRAKDLFGLLLNRYLEWKKKRKQ